MEAKALVHRGGWSTDEECPSQADGSPSDGRTGGDMSDNTHAKKDYNSINGGTHVVCDDSDTTHDGETLLAGDSEKDEGGNDGDSGEERTICGMEGVSRSDILSLVLMIWITFISGASYSLLGPFLPSEVKQTKPCLCNLYNGPSACGVCSVAYRKYMFGRILTCRGGGGGPKLYFGKYLNKEYPVSCFFLFSFFLSKKNT